VQLHDASRIALLTSGLSLEKRKTDVEVIHACAADNEPEPLDTV
jgi:hypothetical protein